MEKEKLAKIRWKKIRDGIHLTNLMKRQGQELSHIYKDTLLQQITSQFCDEKTLLNNYNSQLEPVKMQEIKMIGQFLPNKQDNTILSGYSNLFAQSQDQIQLYQPNDSPNIIDKRKLNLKFQTNNILEHNNTASQIKQIKNKPNNKSPYRKRSSLGDISQSNENLIKQILFSDSFASSPIHMSPLQKKLNSQKQTNNLFFDPSEPLDSNSKLQFNNEIESTNKTPSDNIIQHGTIDDLQYEYQQNDSPSISYQLTFNDNALNLKDQIIEVENYKNYIQRKSSNSLDQQISEIVSRNQIADGTDGIHFSERSQ